ELHFGPIVWSLLSAAALRGKGKRDSDQQRRARGHSRNKQWHANLVGEFSGGGWFRFSPRAWPTASEGTGYRVRGTVPQRERHTDDDGCAVLVCTLYPVPCTRHILIALSTSLTFASISMGRFARDGGGSIS